MYWQICGKLITIWKRNNPVSLPFGACKIGSPSKMQFTVTVWNWKETKWRETHQNWEPLYLHTAKQTISVYLPVMCWEKVIIVSEWKFICSNDLQNSLKFSSSGNLMKKAITFVCYGISPISQMPDTHTSSQTIW